MKSSLVCNGHTYHGTQMIMKRVLAMVDQGSSIHKAAVMCGLPDQTLRDRFRGRINRVTERSGPAPLFSWGEEEACVEYFTQMSNIGYAYTRTELLKLAKYMVDYPGKSSYFTRKSSSSNMSYMWLQRFLNRSPQLRIGRPRSLAIARTMVTSHTAIDSYFSEMDKSWRNMTWNQSRSSYIT